MFDNLNLIGSLFGAMLAGLWIAVPVVIIKIQARLKRLEEQAGSLVTQTGMVTAELKRLRAAQELTNQILCTAHNIEYPEKTHNGNGAIRVSRGAVGQAL